MIRRICERQVIRVGAIAILAIGIAGAITYSRVQLLNDATGRVNRTERVRFALQRTLLTLQGAESAVRGQSPEQFERRIAKWSSSMRLSRRG